MRVYIHCVLCQWYVVQHPCKLVFWNMLKKPPPICPPRICIYCLCVMCSWHLILQYPWNVARWNARSQPLPICLPRIHVYTWKYIYICEYIACNKCILCILHIEAPHTWICSIQTPYTICWKMYTICWNTAQMKIKYTNTVYYILKHRTH